MNNSHSKINFNGASYGNEGPKLSFAHCTKEVQDKECANTLAYFNHTSCNSHGNSKAYLLFKK